MLKRIFDIIFSLFGLIIFSPVILITVTLIWMYDYNNPFYTPLRMGRGMVPFKMYKFRSMVINADKSGVNSTSGNDKRITPVGKIIRRFKLDEISQFINVLMGDMSFVGPRPQVVDHVINEYTNFEKGLLSVKPGITDISSIVFSDEGDILKDSEDPDKDYNALIRPWKSRLGILYVNNHNLILDIKLILITIVAIIDKKAALKFINNILIKICLDLDLINVCKREDKLSSSKLL
uniref:sugar transferase n=1 Tax=Algoriphagus sp. TaxID=1872435 RepID=UPI004047F888